MGANMVGIVHPCKVYGAMAAARPILLVGPNPCHVSDLIEKHQIGWRIAHGDVDGALQVLREMVEMPRERLDEMGRNAAAVVQTSLSKSVLCGVYCDVMEAGVGDTAERRTTLTGTSQVATPTPWNATSARAGHIEE